MRHFSQRCLPLQSTLDFPGGVGHAAAASALLAPLLWTWLLTSQALYCSWLLLFFSNTWTLGYHSDRLKQTNKLAACWEG